MEPEVALFGRLGTHLEGGWFEYRAAPAIFGERTGCGPLRVAWDTCILIDWELCSGAWGEDLLEESVAGEEGVYAEELVALGAIMHVWMTRDIRVRCFGFQARDSGRPLPVLMSGRRDLQLRDVDMGITCTYCEEDGCSGGRLPDLRYAFPNSMDRDRRLVEEAIAAGCHVFLSRDLRLLKKLRHRCADVPIACMAPTDLLDALAFAGGLTFSAPDGSVCDNHKWVHFLPASGSSWGPVEAGA